jgi:hypothetical protein
MKLAEYLILLFEGKLTLSDIKNRVSLLADNNGWKLSSVSIDSGSSYIFLKKGSEKIKVRMSDHTTNASGAMADFNFLDGDRKNVKMLRMLAQDIVAGKISKAAPKGRDIKQLVNKHGKYLSDEADLLASRVTDAKLKLERVKRKVLIGKRNADAVDKFLLSEIAASKALGNHLKIFNVWKKSNFEERRVIYLKYIEDLSS